MTQNRYILFARMFGALMLALAGMSTLALLGSNPAHAASSAPHQRSTPLIAANTTPGGLVNSVQPNGVSYCLGISNGSTSAGASTIMWACNGNSDQVWTVQLAGWDGRAYWNWINKKSGQCLALYQGTAQQGAVPIQWPCNGHTDQQWYNPGLTLINRNSGLCLGVWQGSVFSGANPVQWACNGHADQNWSIG